MSKPSKLAETTTKTFKSGGKEYHYSSLPELGRALNIDLKKLPISIRIVLESVLRNCDGTRVLEKDVENLAKWDASKPSDAEIPFTVARIVLQDFTGVPLLVDLAAMRGAVSKLGKNPKSIEPLVPVDLVIDHSVQVDYAGSESAYQKNLEKEFERNGERYEFLKWGQQAFDTFKVVPPGIGIIHQVNLENLARGVLNLTKDGKNWALPDTLVGTDSHTTMINGVGVVGWGVGGIEAEAGMLGQPVYFLTPEVVGFYLHGRAKEGVTATDIVLTCTNILRKAKVVGKFVEFFGPGAKALSLADRATIANMAPEYGATMGFFPVDEETLNYYRSTGRPSEQIALVEDYFKAQDLFGIPQTKDEVRYSQVIDLDLSQVEASVAGPKRPQDLIALRSLKSTFRELFQKPKVDGGYGFNISALDEKFSVEADAGNPQLKGAQIKHGSVLIAAITSCTNTSNPSVMVAAGLVAKKAVERGLKVDPTVKTSLAPGSRVVTDYLEISGLQKYLNQIGFNLVGYGCTTCIGNSGPLAAPIEGAILQYDLVGASVLSGNRNFEARVHPNIKANFLMSPPLVVAFALAGTVDIDLATQPIAKDKNGQDVYLKDLWPTNAEIQATLATALRPESFQKLYKNVADANPAWSLVKSSVGELYAWNEKSTYIQEPPFFEDFKLQAGKISAIENARPLLILGDSVTTDHISPAGSFKKEHPAGKYLMDEGVEPLDFNSYGSRRGNDRVMTRGTFANVRIKNLMVPGTEGGITRDFSQKDAPQKSVFEASMNYQKQGIPLVVIGGKEYGTGSSRDWAAKGTALLGVKAVVTESFERIHRSNLVGMGVLPLCFEEGTNAQTLKLDGSEIYSFEGLSDAIRPRERITLKIKRSSGQEDRVPVIVRIDTPIEVDYYRHGGILLYVLRQILARS